MEFALRVAAVLVFLGVVAVIVHESGAAPGQQAAQEHIASLRERIAAQERENAVLRETLTYAKSVSAVREAAKRELGLVDPGDRAIVILGDVPDPPRVPSEAAPAPSPDTRPPAEVGHVNRWLQLFRAATGADR